MEPMYWVETPDGGVKPATLYEHVALYEGGIAARRVAFDTDDETDVSTVFLGMDHSFGEGPPVLYETMVFPAGTVDDRDCRRYRTRAEAVAGHAEMVAKWLKTNTRGDA